jgi:hypothetical protein
VPDELTADPAVREALRRTGPTLARRLAFGGAPVTADLGALVFQKTEGNPLFMRDLVRYLQEARDALSPGDFPNRSRGRR